MSDELCFSYVSHLKRSSVVCDFDEDHNTFHTQFIQKTRKPQIIHLHFLATVYINSSYLFFLSEIDSVVISSSIFNIKSFH